MMLNIFSLFCGIAITLLILSAINFMRQKHIAPFLLSLALISSAIVEASRLLYGLHAVTLGRFFGLGICVMIIFWLLAGFSFLPQAAKTAGRQVSTVVFCLISLGFLFFWWIKPEAFIFADNITGQLSKVSRYFFVLLIFASSLSLSHFERASYFVGRRRMAKIFTGVGLLLAPYIVLSAYSVFFSDIPQGLWPFMTLSVFAGSVVFVFASRRKVSLETIEEDTTVQTSLTLSLIGGYLFFIGAFIKLFQIFGWNLEVLFSFFTTVFLLFILFGFVFSSSLKQRVKNVVFRRFTRQKYDWQKIWEDFTYKISLVTDTQAAARQVEKAIADITRVRGVKVFVFEDDIPFEEAFASWFLRRAQVFDVAQVFDNGFGEKFKKAREFFKKYKLEAVAPLFGDKEIIGIIGFRDIKNAFFDSELLKILSLQASSVILNCRANAALREAEKKESLYKVSSFIIHDVKNYINGLSLLVANKDKIASLEFQKDAMFTVENTIKKMGRLMDEFKALRGDLSLNRQPADLSLVVKEALDDVGRNRAKGVTVREALDEQIKVMADAHYIYKVIVNLIINAFEAVGEAGGISITVKREGYSGIVSVKDTGCGMSAEFIETKLFKPFSSTKNKGLGIGLYQCKTIIEAHGGTICVMSAPGEGTEFVVKLPLNK